VHKVLMLLGILRQGPMSGYDLHRFVRAHGAVSADLKKANVYYLLERLAADGYLHAHAEASAHGERLLYSLTDLGRARFDELLREVAVMFLGNLMERERTVHGLRHHRTLSWRQRLRLCRCVPGRLYSSHKGRARLCGRQAALY
jgi:DNA-binding PadR family transcriptional regulator